MIKIAASTITLNDKEIYSVNPNAPAKPTFAEKLVAEAQNKPKKKANKTRGKDKADKTDLDKQGRRDRIRQEMTRQNNIARLKARMAEKVKRSKEVKEMGAIEAEVVSRIPDIVKQRLEKKHAKDRAESRE